MVEVHAPVSRLNDQLAGPIAQFFERLQPDRSFWRLGWGVIETPDLFQPLGNAARAESSTTVPEPDDMHVRVERETLRRLPRTGAILFTIRTYITKASDLLERSPDDGARLADAIAAMPDGCTGLQTGRRVRARARAALRRPFQPRHKS